MRLLLLLWIAMSLAPGLGELAESAVHLATAGHLAHCGGGHGDAGDQGDEHGCGATHHLCDCCSSQVLAVSPSVAVPGAAPAALRPANGVGALVSLHDPTAPFRPPITS